MEKKDYEKNMQYIAEMYKTIKKEIENDMRPKIPSYKLDTGLEFVNYIDTMTSLMPVEFERIIRNDYLVDRRTVKWWQKYYSKSTYYRRKQEAVEIFVDCLS